MQRSISRNRQIPDITLKIIPVRTSSILKKFISTGRKNIQVDVIQLIDSMILRLIYPRSDVVFAGEPRVVEGVAVGDDGFGEVDVAVLFVLPWSEKSWPLRRYEMGVFF